jgi:predicted AAA+ superfamily ATPase
VSEDLATVNSKKKHAELQRFLKLPKNQSFFLFGPRGSGKSTLINNNFNNSKTMLLNLLDPVLEERLIRNPRLLIEMINAAGKSINHVFIDEVQKIPKLLDLVHLLIETTSLKFILTGSSARKLKHGGANLLAGRAFVYNLHPFSFFELNNLSLKQVLEWGLLPKIFHLSNWF